MNAKQILAIPEIKKQVYDKFPISKAERKCDNEKSTMDQLRINMAKKLFHDGVGKEKVEYK